MAAVTLASFFDASHNTIAAQLLTIRLVPELLLFMKFKMQI
jgi:hypothetical protein